MNQNTKDKVDEQASAGNTLLGPGEEVTAVDSLGVHTMMTPLMKATEFARTKSPREDNRPPPKLSRTDTLTLNTYPDNTHGSLSGQIQGKNDSDSTVNMEDERLLSDVQPPEDMMNISDEDVKPTVATSSHCCSILEEKLRSEFKKEMDSFRKKIENEVRESKEQITILKEMIIHKDEIVEVKNQDLKQKDKQINELKKQVEKLNEKVTKLTNASLYSNTHPRLPNNQTHASGIALKSLKPKRHSLFYNIKFESEVVKRSLDPFKLESEIRSKISAPPKSIKSSGRDGFLVEVSTAEEGKALESLKEISSQTCRISTYEFFNVQKGILYVYNNDFDDIESFKEGLNEQFPVASIIHAHWIKPKNPRAKAFMISFSLENLPEQVHIPGEYTKTKVYPYKDRPMQCAFCQEYGHVAKRCSAKKATCGKCSGSHSTSSCENQVLLCCLCQGSHRTTSPDCTRRQEEIKIIETQKKMKMGRADAINSLKGHGLPDHRVQYTKFYDLNLDREVSRKSCPFKIEKFIKDTLGIPSSNIKASRSGYTLKCENPDQSNRVKSIKKIGNTSCTVSENRFFNQSKGIIYINKFEIPDKEKFCANLTEQFQLQEAVHAKWIKCKNANTTPFLLNFSTPQIPQVLRIPGETTTVYEYKPRPLFCTNCLEYSHSKNKCENRNRCRTCAQIHGPSQCTGKISCLHCRGDHKSGDKSCKIEQDQRSICDIQNKQKINWITAKQIFQASKPGPTSYAAVTAGPSKRGREEDTQVEPSNKVKKRTNSADRPATPANRTPHPDETSENNEYIREESLQEFEKFNENITNLQNA